MFADDEGDLFTPVCDDGGDDDDIFSRPSGLFTAVHSSQQLFTDVDNDQVCLHYIWRQGEMESHAKLHHSYSRYLEFIRHQLNHNGL